MRPEMAWFLMLLLNGFYFYLFLNQLDIHFFSHLFFVASFCLNIASWKCKYAGDYFSNDHCLLCRVDVFFLFRMNECKRYLGWLNMQLKRTTNQPHTINASTEGRCLADCLHLMCGQFGIFGACRKKVPMLHTRANNLIFSDKDRFKKIS